jgi:hypothetical protein
MRKYSGLSGVVMIGAWKNRLRREKIKKHGKDVDCQDYLWAEFTHIAFYFS